jgi:hypothetical protein
VWIDHCWRCGGSFVEPEEVADAIGEHADPSKWQPRAFARPATPSRLFCPSGHGRLVSYHLRYDGKEVEIDGCLTCRGLWLDTRKAEILAAITAAVHDEMAMPGASKGPLGVMAMYLLQVTTLLPSKVHAPLKRKPVLVPIAIALMTVIFAIQIALIFSKQLDPFLHTFALIPADVARGKNTLSLATHSLLHGGVAHLLGNMYTLYVFGDNVEDVLGGARAALLYWASAIAGGLLYFVVNVNSSTMLVGASGAIAGLMGAYLVLLPRVKLWLVIFFVPVKIRVYWYLGVWFLLQFAIMYDPKSRIAWEAHVGGFITGVVLAFVLRRRETTDVPPSLRPNRGRGGHYVAAGQ